MTFPDLDCQYVVDCLPTPGQRTDLLLASKEILRLFVRMVYNLQGLMGNFHL